MSKILKKITILIMTAALALGTTACAAGQSSVFAAAGTDYDTIYDIPNIQFQIPQSFINSSTAITEITESSDFADNVAYLYKNGKDQYILFSINELVIACQADTGFNFESAEDKTTPLETKNVMGIWMESAKDSGMDYSEETTQSGVYKIIANVSAEVTITKDLFGDFVGKLASVSYKGKEWSLFVGVPGDSFAAIPNNRMTIINNVAKSIMPGTDPNSITYEFESDGNSSTEAATEASTEADTENDVEVNMKEVEPAAPPTEEEKKTPVERSNQQEKKEETPEDEDKAKDSSIYSFLMLGEKGALEAVSDNTGEAEEMAITIKNVLTGQDAINAIKAYAASGEAGYEYTEPPVGTRWEVAEYDLDYSGLSDKPYVNIRFCGLDGKALRHAGIAYTTRTYDMHYLAKDDGTGYMVYYAVPINTTEYSLIAGIGDVGQEKVNKAAYYHIYEQKSNTYGDESKTDSASEQNDNRSEDVQEPGTDSPDDSDADAELDDATKAASVTDSASSPEVIYE